MKRQLTTTLATALLALTAIPTTARAETAVISDEIYIPPNQAIVSDEVYIPPNQKAVVSDEVYIPPSYVRMSQEIYNPPRRTARPQIKITPAPRPQRKAAPAPKRQAGPRAINYKGTCIAFNDKIIPITALFGELDSSNARTVQQTINRGHAICAFNRIDNNDGKTSYVAGHNPGIMSPLAAYVGEGKRIIVQDVHGGRRYYRLHYLGQQYFNGGRLEGRYVNEIYKEQEALFIQFCRSGKIEFWSALPQ